MCRSQAEGGQRCAGHAGAQLRAATDAYVAVLLDTPDDRERVDAAYQRIVTAEEDYASTPTGRSELAGMLEDGALPEVEARVTRALEVGAHLRERNRIVRNAAAAMESGGSPFGTTGDRETDYRMWQMVTAVRDQPDRFRTPLGERDRVPGLKTYKSVAEQEAGVARWERGVHQAARETNQGMFHTNFDMSEAGLAAETRRTEAYGVKMYRLIVIADRWRRAKAQNPPL